MGINDEYSRDAYNYENAYDSDGSSDFDPYLDHESWQDMYSEELLNVWAAIQEYTYDKYISLSHECTYPKFVDFVLNSGNYPTSELYSFHADQMWNKIKIDTIIRERVSAYSFRPWIDSYIS